MRNFTKNWLWKAYLLILAVMFAGASMSWAQEKEKKEPRKDPSTIIELPLAPEGGRAVGDDCTNPIIVSIPSELPYSNSNTTCDRDNHYTYPNIDCMSRYAGGQDIIYRLDVTADIIVKISMDPQGTTWTGLGIFLGCPGASNNVACVTGASGTIPKVLTNINLVAGNQYYVMVDTWPLPSCIPSFTLEIVDVTPPPPPPGSCIYKVSLYDSYGDSWNGGLLSVYVDGVAWLIDISLYDGYGPADYYFYATTGAEITTTYTPGNWSYENEYYIYFLEDFQIWASGEQETTPEDILPGQLYGRCCGVVSLVGEFNDWGNDGDFNLTRDPVDPDIWTGTLALTNDMNLHDDPDIIEVKFRLNADWTINWGATDFPSGIGFQDGPNIPVPIGLDAPVDEYDIIFNCHTGEYTFINRRFIPISSWALYLGIFLMVTFVIIRFRRVI